VNITKGLERILIVLLMLTLTLFIKPFFVMGQDFFSNENEIALEYGSALCERDNEKFEQLTYGTDYNFERVLEDLAIPDGCETSIAWNKERIKTGEGMIITLYLHDKAGDGWLTPNMIAVELIGIPNSEFKVYIP
jgi:hypothetical protein